MPVGDSIDVAVPSVQTLTEIQHPPYVLEEKLSDSSSQSPQPESRSPYKYIDDESPGPVAAVRRSPVKNVLHINT